MTFACLTLVLSALALATPAVAQSKPPAALLQALHCAKTEHFDLLETSLGKNDIVKASFAHYVETGPDVEGFVLVIYESPSEGAVLDYVREVEHGKVQLYLVNNASFSVSPTNVLHVDDALGGVWTQGHLKQRVKRAMRATYSIPSSKLAAPFQNVVCHAPWNPD
ncbi:MAG TPA: hypothetical protein VFQ41_17055 [Candidatus Angelobacter sp.]|nr:hypothetical protein [Candidatus Angelobacter sp.]